MPAREGFRGLRVLTFESRRATEIAKLIETYGGVAISAPAMREIPLSENKEALRFGRDLVAGSVDLVVFLTGVGARALLNIISSEQPPEVFFDALRKVRIAARGPKPIAVLREWKVQVDVTAPEPNTWRELLRSLEDLPGGLHALRVAVQEYGVSNSEFLAALRERGAVVTQIPVYQWGLPEDTAPLRKAVRAIIDRDVDVVLFTTGVQASHLFQMASEGSEKKELREALQEKMIASIGPSTSETLETFGISADMEPTHPKMGILVKEAAERSAELLSAKLQH